MNPIAFHVGPIPVHWYGVIIALAFALGILLAFYHAGQRQVNMDKFNNLVILVIPAAIIGARLYYVVFQWSYYAANPSEIIMTWHGGLAIHGGVIGGALAGFCYIYRNREVMNFWQNADIVAPSIILGQAIGRWGNFLNQEAHGGPVSEEFISRFPEFIKQGMLIDGQYYNPTFLYESLWNALVFLILFWMMRRKNLPHGVVAASYLILYSVGRFFVEGMRTDSLMLGPFRAAQVVSVLAIVLGAVLIYFRTQKAVRQ